MPLDGVVPYPPEFAARYRRRGYWRDTPHGQAYAEYFRRFPERLALVYRDERVTYGELGERVERVALNLLELGYRPLDRVVMQLPNSSAFIYLYFALQRIGAIPLMALPAHREHEIGHYVDFVEAKGYAIAARVGSFDFVEFARGILGKAKTVEHVFIDGPAQPDAWAISIDDLLARTPSRAPAELDALAIDPDDPCVFQLSGGTTGIPKVIPRTHNDYLFNTEAVARWVGMSPYTVLLVAAPIAHNFPLATPGLGGTLVSGGTVVISPTPRASDVLPLIAAESVTDLEGTPAMYISWLEDDAIGSHDLSSVRIIRCAGQKCPTELKHRVEATFPNGFLTEGFGMGEGLIMWTRAEDPVFDRIGSVGRPWCPDDELRIVDEDDRVVAEGEPGELQVRGPYTLRGYFRAPETNERAFTDDGFYRTGDVFRRLPSGYLTVEGRKKDLINRGGEKISAEEVENLILAYPGVRNISCVSVPDRVMGEKMCACLILDEGVSISAEDLGRHLGGAGLARFKHPEWVVEVESFPLSPFGKVQKNVLSALAADRLGLVAP